MHKRDVFTIDEAKKKLEYYCAYQERCHQEVIHKLRQMNMIPQVVDTIIGHLIKHNYLNETRFAQAYTRGKFTQKKWGKKRIVRELKIRDISIFNINIALREIEDEDYLKTLKELTEKLWNKHLNRETIIQNKKVVDALIYRGWETDLIFEAIQNLKNKRNAK